jgi:hypothetical protein
MNYSSKFLTLQSNAKIVADCCLLVFWRPADNFQKAQLLKALDEFDQAAKDVRAILEGGDR